MSYNKHDTVLTDAQTFDPSRLVFSEPIVNSVPNSAVPINYRRINVMVRNRDGTIGDLVLSTERVFSFGISENLNPQTKEVNGYSLPLCLYNKDGPSERERKWVETFDAIVERCKSHLLEHRDDIEKYELERSDLKNLNPLYWKKERGRIVPGTGPALYCKLIVSRRDGELKIISMFRDKTNKNDLDPEELMKKYCWVRTALKIESIYIGNSISLQVKLWEAEVEVMEKGMKRFLDDPERPRLLDSDKGSSSYSGNHSMHSANGSLQNSDDEEYY
jgi:hypothetical protein